MDALDKNIPTQSDLLQREEQQSLQRYGQIHNTHQKGDMVCQRFLTSDIDDNIMERLGMVNGIGMNDNDKRQVYTINLLQQVLNRLVILENRTQAVMTQNYELHEYPIP
ncbi:hypothetical protein BGZ65_000466, partial [Modicella reniformis]